MTRTDVAIPIAGGELAAYVYEPETPSGVAVVLAHGFSLTRRDGLPAFAEVFAAAGVTAVVFDYRHFGESSGEPRQRFNIKSQQQDLGVALAYARTLPGVTRVVAWGYSFGAGHVTTLAAAGADLAAVLVLCPFVDGLRRVFATPPRTTAWMLPRAVASALGRRVTVPVTARAGEFGAMNLPGECEGFHSAAPPGSGWRNEITPEVFLGVAGFRPITRASRITVPMWVGMGERDISVDAAAARRLVERAPAGELHSYDMDHFEPFSDTWAPVIARDQVDFLKRAGLLGAKSWGASS